MDNVFESFFKNQAEERRLQEAEREIRYANRRKDKYAHRERVEQAAAKICAIVEAETEKAEHSPNDIVLLAAALSHAATAVSTTETYSEYIPYTTFSIGI